MIIDFETFSDIQLSQTGVWRYVASPWFDVMCMRYGTNERDARIWFPGQQFPLDLAQHIQAGKPLHAWNAQFESVVWDWCVRNLGWPKVRFSQWHCTQAACLAYGGPYRLDYAGDMFGMSQKKDTTGKKVMMRLSKPDPKTGQRIHPTQEQTNTLASYCLQDIVSEGALAKYIGRHPEQTAWQLCQKINQRGLYVNVDFAKAAVRLWERYRSHKVNEFEVLTSGIAPTQVAELTSYLDKQVRKEINEPCLSLGKDYLISLLDKPLSRKTKHIIAQRIELGGNAVLKYATLIKAAGKDKRIRGCFRYHKGHTGRWGGALIQPQNLARGIVKPERIPEAMRLVMEGNVKEIEASFGGVGAVLGSLVRPTIQAAPGKILTVADFSGIEARVLAWAAGEQHMLDTFRNGEDPYVAMASRAFRKPKHEIGKDLRFIGKQLVLGCGYQMGGQKFKYMLETKFKQKIELDIAKSYVHSYRSANPNIVQLWWDLDNAFKKCLESGKPVKIFDRKRDWVRMRLPSGRYLHYYKPKLVPGEYGQEIIYTGVDTQSGRPVTKKTYGGSLTENLVQAVSRDLLLIAMQKCEAFGLPVVGHIHDEIIVEDTKPRLRELVSIMQQVPRWAANLPVAAEGFESTFFRKAD